MIPFQCLNDKYDIIYVDPPWKFKNKKTGGSLKSGAEQKYEVMSLQDLCNLNVKDISADNCVLVMWWVSSMPKEALAVVKAWGFEVKTMTGFAWLKQTKNLLDCFGLGFWTRPQMEFALIATKGKVKRADKSVRQLIRAVNRRHSEKPAETRDRIVKLFGDKRRIELFARQRVEGWECWGKEVS